MTKLLLSHGASVQKSPELLRIATKNICKDLVEILLQNKADIDAIDEHGTTALHLNASQNLFFSLIDLSYSVNSFGTKAEIAKMLLSMGANVDAKTKDKKITALHIACSQTNPDVVKVLLEYKANVNCLVGDVSPLMIAAKRGNASIMKMLIANGASVNLKRNNGDSVLHILARTSHTDALKVLLENDADVYSTNSEGQTPLHYASCNPNDEIASLLLQNMSHSDLKDNAGRTPLVLAVKSCHTSIVKLLLDFGSDINVVLNDNYTLFKITQNVRTPQMYISDDEDNDYYVDRYCYNTKYFAIINVLKKHTIKLRIAGLYVSKRNINFLRNNEEFDDFLFDCECEINKIKQEKIANNKISLYDILTKNIHSLANYARNADVIQYFNSENYKTKFVIYAPFIERNFKNGYRRRLLLEQGHMFFKCYLKLPIDCSELILTYLSDADLENIINIVSKMP
ncbi:putative ankyrin repeat protein RF_0381 [Eupeodes corollae]|uniref:putative ankyrin repeat protein RF_0381 n=1 Tax=Eupeodes corollae TaxID=290404 RepID=UPI00248F99E3|nr:putative ankyrin repeat protein RF_0381 [Eupeodes corollae]